MFCSDAFHYFIDKAGTIWELERFSGKDGLIILTWIRNALVKHPYPGVPLPPEGYQALVAGLPHRLLTDREVLDRYLQKRGPPLAHSADIGHLEHEPVLSVVASRRQDAFQDSAPFEV